MLHPCWALLSDFSCPQAMKPTWPGTTYSSWSDCFSPLQHLEWHLTLSTHLHFTLSLHLCLHKADDWQNINMPCSGVPAGLPLDVLSMEARSSTPVPHSNTHLSFLYLSSWMLSPLQDPPQTLLLPSPGLDSAHRCSIKSLSIVSSHLQHCNTDMCLLWVFPEDFTLPVYHKC